MPIQTSYPGVYIEEKPSGNFAISAVPVANLLAIGMTQKGSMGEEQRGKPVRVLDYAQFEAEFGGDVGGGNEMSQQIRQFFTAGGGLAYIIRVANGSVKSTTTLVNEYGANTLDIEARDEGLFGDQIRIIVDYNTPNPEISFNLTIYREVIDALGRYSRDEDEYFSNLSMAPTSINYIDTVLQNSSKLIRVASTAAAPATSNRCFSQSGLIFTAANAGAAETACIAFRDAQVATQAGTHIGLLINEKHAIDVNISTPADLDGIESAINDALLANNITGSVAVSMNAFGTGSFALRIESADPELHTLNIRRARSNDIAEAMQLGTPHGGFETSRYSQLRPAPSGYSSHLGSSDASANRLSHISTIVSEDVTNADGWTWTDFNGAESQTWAAAPSGTFAAGDNTDGDGSLLNLRAHLDAMVASLNASLGQHWAFTRQGLRVVALPKSEESAAYGSTASLATTTTDLGIFTGRAALGRAFNLAGGSDGTAPLLEQYNTAFDTAKREIDVANIVILPRCVGQIDDDRQLIWGAASAHCRDFYSFLLVDPPSDANAWSDVNTVDAEIDNMRLGLLTTHSAIYWPRIEVTDGANRRFVDPCGTVAGAMASVAAKLGIWHAPAGAGAPLLGAVGLEHLVTDKEHGVLNVQAVNVLRQFPEGALVYGARTLAGADNSGEFDYNSVAIRQTASMIEQSLLRGMRWAIFEPNDHFLWSNMRQVARSFMNSLYLQGAFKGRKAEDAFKVICDEKINTPSEILLNRVNLWVMFMPQRHVEYVVIRIQQMQALPQE